MCPGESRKYDTICHRKDEVTGKGRQRKTLFKLVYILSTKATFMKQNH